MEKVVVTGGALMAEEIKGDPADFWFPSLKLKDADYKELIGGRGLRYLTDATKMALVTATMAKDNAQIQEIVPERCGIVVTTNFSSVASVMKFDYEAITAGPRAVSAMQSPNLVLNAAAAKMGMHFNITGFNTTISSGRGGGLDAMEYACNMIGNQEVDMVIVAGVEEMPEELREWLVETNHMSAEALAELRGCAGTIVLETQSHAQQRGAKIYGEILACCSTFNGNYLVSGGTEEDDAKEYGYMVSQLVDNPEQIKNVCVSDNRINGKDRYEAKYVKEHLPHAEVIAIRDAFEGEFVGATGVVQILYSLQQFRGGKGVIFCSDWTGNFRALLLQKHDVNKDKE